ncbi:MAG: NADH-quinone oxidoreductase subunit M, partial [Rhizobiales bacterium]|nr:NADH-quinone oxidoreductase subunit M [Hyphomicrobiales bacterium]
TFRTNVVAATLATLGVILSACYALWLYRKVVFGKLEKPSLAAIRDMGWREIAIFAPLVVLTLWLGFYPKPVLDVSAVSLTALLDHYHHSVSVAQSAALMK